MEKIVMAVKSRTPRTMAEFQDALHDEPSVRGMANRGELPAFVNAYVRVALERDRGIENQIRSDHTKQLKSLADSVGADASALQQIANASAKSRVAASGWRTGAEYSSAAPGAVIDDLFGCTADVVQMAWHRSDGMSTKESHMKVFRAKMVQHVMNSYGSVVPADGGFLVPEQVRADLLTASLQSAVMRPRCTVLPMDSLRLGVPTTDEVSRTSSSVFGGFSVFWVEEGSPIPTSSANFARTELEAKKLEAFAAIPNELMADGPALQAFLTVAAPSAIRFAEDSAFMYGSGVGEPLGCLNGGATITVDAAVTSHVTFSDIAAMYTRMLPGSYSSAVWVASSDLLPDLLTLSFKGPATTEIDVSPGVLDFDSNGGLRLMGRPLFVSETAPPAGTDGALAFIDPTHYLVGDRQILQLTTSAAGQGFPLDTTQVKFLERVDGRPWLQSAITPANGSANTLSAFVVLSGTHT